MTISPKPFRELVFVMENIIVFYSQIAKVLKITPILDKLPEYKRSWIQHVNRMPRNRLPRVMKYYSPTDRRNHCRPLKRLLVAWDRNGSTSGPTPWKIYDDDDDYYYYDYYYYYFLLCSNCNCKYFLNELQFTEFIVFTLFKFRYFTWVSERTHFM